MVVVVVPVLDTSLNLDIVLSSAVPGSSVVVITLVSLVNSDTSPISLLLVRIFALHHIALVERRPLAIIVLRLESRARAFRSSIMARVVAALGVVRAVIIFDLNILVLVLAAGLDLVSADGGARVSIVVGWRVFVLPVAGLAHVDVAHGGRMRAVMRTRMLCETLRVFGLWVGEVVGGR